jgi:hypothetical protein
VDPTRQGWETTFMAREIRLFGEGIRLLGQLSRYAMYPRLGSMALYKIQNSIYSERNC